MRLSPKQKDDFHREGYLVVEDLFNADDFELVRDEITRAIDRLSARSMEEGALSQSYAEESFETRLTRITAETDQVYKAIAHGKLHGKGVFKLLTNPALLDLV